MPDSSFFAGLLGSVRAFREKPKHVENHAGPIEILGQ
jgi:hypothetical protein